MELPNQIIFRRGETRVVYEDNEAARPDELYEVERVAVVGVGAPLPSGMFASYTVRRSMTDGRERIEGKLQARAPGGRRYFVASDETAVQARLLKWSARILRELRSAS